MNYYRDFSIISLENYKTQLLKHHLLPSWQILLEDIEQNLSKTTLGINDALFLIQDAQLNHFMIEY